MASPGRLAHRAQHAGRGLVDVAWPRLRALSIWRDWVVLGAIAAALVVNAVDYLMISQRLGELPPLLPLHYDGAGEVDLIGPPGDLFRMPIIGTVVIAANLIVAAALHGDERTAARLLAVASVVVQALMLGATSGIIARAFG